MSRPAIRCASLDAPNHGIVELSCDWMDDVLPSFRLRPEGEGRIGIERVSLDAFARASGFFVDSNGDLLFVVSPADQSAIDLTTAVYLAGDFNGWDAVGRPEWRLETTTFAGEPVLGYRTRPERLAADPPLRFKFVTAEHHWLPVPSHAPNAVRDPMGTYNRAVDLTRTGRHLFRFFTKAPIDLSTCVSIRWADDGDREEVVIRPGDFFLAFKTDAALGALIEGDDTIFRLFAPRATWVRVHLAERTDALESATVHALVRRVDGAWEVRCNGNRHGWYYWYTLDGPSGPFGAFDPTRRVLDPYALATCGREGPGIVIDRARLCPGDRAFPTPAWQDLVIAEAHVRDLTAHASVAAGLHERGGFSGLRQWVESPDCYLTHLGINAIELQPVQESDSSDRDEYHWGYMAVNWFAPESSYALAPERASQILELQALVTACHRRGLAVLLDVAYSHVGLPPHLMAIDKLYYFEQDAAGVLANWSGCGNDLRAAAPMAQRLIVDSMVHFLEVYGVDGFRLDLAELLGLDVLREIEVVLKRIKPEVVLIAEPWSFRGHIARDLQSTGYTSWNDGFRNFVRGYVRGEGTRDAFVHFLTGAPDTFAAWPAQTVNYTESHDDQTWIDGITENAGHDGDRPTLDDRRRTHLMAAFLFAAIGIPMVASGQDFLRSKRGRHNTYQCGDLNAVDYRRLYRFPATHAYFADWIAFRLSERGRLLRHYSRPAPTFFRFFFAPDSVAGAALYNADGSHGPSRLLFAINPTSDDAEIPLGEVASAPWQQVADHERFDVAARRGATLRVRESLFVPALSCGLWTTTD